MDIAEIDLEKSCPIFLGRVMLSSRSLQSLIECRMVTTENSFLIVTSQSLHLIRLICTPALTSKRTVCTSIPAEITDQTVAAERKRAQCLTEIAETDWIESSCTVYGRHSLSY